MMLDLSMPAATTLSTSRRPSRAAMTAGGSSTAASRSRSPIVGCRRRSDPAASIRRTPRASRSRSMRPATSASASWMSSRSCVRARCGRCRRGCSVSVRSERPFTWRSRPSSAAARSASTRVDPELDVEQSHGLAAPRPGCAGSRAGRPGPGRAAARSTRAGRSPRARPASRSARRRRPGASAARRA